MDLRERRVSLESDPFWPDRFETERDRIRSVAGDGLLGCFHVGSTAIRGVPGKPALDVIAVYADADALEAAAGALVEVEGFERPPEGELVIRWDGDEAVFVKLHKPDDARVRAELAFRDYLRDHADARRRYAAVKRDAAADHPDDLEAYTKAKGEFVADVLDRARADGYFDDLPPYA